MVDRAIINMQKQTIKKQVGFTLVELITVIALLSVLVITALPKFIDISSDAKRATMRQLEGTLREATKLVYLKSVLEGEENISKIAFPPPDVDGILTHYGHPIRSEIQGLVNLSENDWRIEEQGTYLFILPADITAVVNSQAYYDANGTGADACNITFQQSNIRPYPQSITSHLDGC